MLKKLNLSGGSRTYDGTGGGRGHNDFYGNIVDLVVPYPIFP